MSDHHSSGADHVELDLRDLFGKLFKHKWIFIFSVLISIVGALVISYTQTPVYRATSRLMVEGEPPKIVKVEQVVLPDYVDSTNFFNSQIEILKSHTLAEMVYKDIGGYIPWGSRKDPEIQKNYSDDERIELLLKHVKISPVRLTQIINVSVEDVDRKVAARIANSWTRAYLFFSSVDQLIQRKSELETDLNHQLKFYKQMHPVILGLKNQIQAIDEKIDNERERLNSMEENSRTPISANSDITNVKILDRAQPPLKPVRPKKAFNVAIGLMLGLFFGGVLVLILELADQSVKTVPELEKLLRLNCLGAVPYHKNKESKNFSPEYVSANVRYSGVAEAFRSLRTAILFSKPDLSKRTIVITSSSPFEGKTTVAMNLATVFAQSNERILLVDADMRKPRVHSLFQIEAEHGLSDVLMNGKRSVESLIHKCDIPGLEILPCGEIPPNPSELLGSHKIDLLIEKLLTIYDRIIFDTPPVLAATDSVVLSTKTDATIFVAKANGVSRQSILRSKQALSSVQARLLGTILNMIRPDSQGYDDYNYFYGHKANKKPMNFMHSVSDFFLFFGLTLAPLMYGAVDFFPKLFLSVITLFTFYLIFIERPYALKPVLNSPISWLGLGMLAFAVVQLIPLPFSILKLISPAAYQLYVQYFPDVIKSGGHAALSLNPADTVRGILQFMTYAVVYITVRMRLYSHEQESIHPISLQKSQYLKWGCLAGVLSILFHSLYDFNLHIMANGMFFAFILALGTGALGKEYDHTFFRKAINYVIVFGFIMAIFACIQKLTFNGHIYWIGMPALEPVASYYNYDHFAGFMELCSAVAVSMVIAKIMFTSTVRRQGLEKKNAWFLSTEDHNIMKSVVMTILMVATIFLSTSRGGIMSFILSQLVFLLFVFGAAGRASKKVRVFNYIGGATLVTLIMVIWLAPQSFQEKFHLTSMQSVLKMEGPINHRLLFYKDTLEVIKDFPIVGTGLNTFATNFTRYRTFDYTPDFLRFTHNDYLQLVSETGIVGLIFLLVFLGVFVVCTQRVVRDLK